MGAPTLWPQYDLVSFSELHEDWVSALQASGIDFNKLAFDVDALYSSRPLSSGNQPTVYPKRDSVFRAFHEVMPNDVRVVVLGQDPYPQQDPGHPAVGIADGLAFSARGHEPPPSLRHLLYNMWVSNEIAKPPGSADLQTWAHKGVLLLNTALSVEPSRDPTVRVQNRKRHQTAYRQLVSATLTYLSRPLGSEPAFLLLGESSRSFRNAIHSPKAGQVIDLNHPSREPWPEPAGEQFPFNRLNSFLGSRAVDWQL